MNNAKRILENLSRGMRMAEWKMSPPHVSKRSAASEGYLCEPDYVVSG